MARKDRTQDEDPEVSNAEEAPDEREVAAEPSLEGLVKMTREGKTIHAHPTAVHEHVKNGWKHA